MNLQDKISIYNALIQSLDIAIEDAQLMLKNTIEARNNESKSTAGDKYETGRAMMQIEQAQNETQLSKLLTLKAHLQQIRLTNKHKKIALGSLVHSNFGNFFLAIPYGKITYKNTDYHVISLASPLGKMMLNKKHGESFHFLNKKYIIEEIC